MHGTHGTRHGAAHQRTQEELQAQHGQFAHVCARVCLQMKQGLLSSMVGGAYVAMALTGAGSFLLERCYGMAVSVGNRLFC